MRGIRDGTFIWWFQRRECNNPAPEGNGKNCTGSAEIGCNVFDCPIGLHHSKRLTDSLTGTEPTDGLPPVDGGWSDWLTVRMCVWTAFMTLPSVPPSVVAARNEGSASIRRYLSCRC